MQVPVRVDHFLLSQAAADVDPCQRQVLAQAPEVSGFRLCASQSLWQRYSVSQWSFVR